MVGQIDPPPAAPAVPSAAAELAAASPSSPKRPADGSALDQPSPKRLKTNSPSPEEHDLEWGDYGTTQPAVHAAILEQTTLQLAKCGEEHEISPDTWTDKGLSLFCNRVLRELVSGPLNSHELSEQHEVYLMTQIDKCRLMLVTPNYAAGL